MTILRPTGSNRRLTFSGRPEVTIPPGAEVLSDPLARTPVSESPARTRLAS